MTKFFETRANLVFMIEVKFSPADAAELRPDSRWM